MGQDITLEELKLIELDMVKYLDGVCRKHNIHYYMVGGTLLGAVRHKGFIPWDDDIDVAMPRMEFEKLQSVMSEEKGYYKIQFYNNTQGYGYPFPKMIDTRTTLIDYKAGTGKEKTSVYIDIFLYDGMGRTLMAAEARYWFLKALKRMVFLSKRNFKMESLGKTLLFSVPWGVCHLIGVDRLNKLYNYFAGRKAFHKTEIVACAAGRYGRGELFPREVFEKTIDLSFEDTVLPAPIEYKKYLRSIYGDFMTLPPVEKRVSNHMSEEWWNDRERVDK